MAVTAADVAEWIKITVPTGTDLEALERVVAAVTVHVGKYHTAPDPVTEDWEQALIMQSARLIKRRTSPEGVIAFDELGAIRVSRLDNDVAALLEPYRVIGFA